MMQCNSINQKRKYQQIDSQEIDVLDSQCNTQQEEQTNFLIQNLVEELKLFTKGQLNIKEENLSNDIDSETQQISIPIQLQTFFNNKFEEQNRNTSKLVKLEIIQNPQKVLRLQNNFMLKNFYIIVEDYLLNPIIVDEQQIQQLKVNIYKTIEYKTNSLEEELEIHDCFSNFKYIDYILHENVNNQQKMEYISLIFQDYTNNQVNIEYLIQRLLSFCDLKCKQLADQIQLIENQYCYQYQQFLQSQKYRQISEEKSFLQQNDQVINQILQKYKNNPVKIVTLRKFQNERLADMQSLAFNKNLLDLIEYQAYEFEYDAMKKLNVPYFEYIGNTEEYQKIYEQVTKFFVDKQPLQQKLILKKNTLYLKTKNGKIIDNLEVEYILENTEQNIYLINIYKILK